MATKRVTHTFRKGDILEVKEYHDGRYGARGLPREKKRKPTPEQMAVVNAMNKDDATAEKIMGVSNVTIRSIKSRIKAKKAYHPSV